MIGHAGHAIKASKLHTSFFQRSTTPRSSLSGGRAFFTSPAMGRSPCCHEQANLKKGPWTTEEDEKLVSCVKKHGHGNWRALPKLGDLNRCSKSCRLRWINYLRPDIKRGKFSDEEEQLIIELHSVLGNKWSTIAARLPGRTDNEIKNYWNTHIRKKLIHMGIDPVTHRPRPNLSLIPNLPNLLAMAAEAGRNMVAPPLDGDAAQLARLQLLQTLVQVLAGGTSSTTMMVPEVGLLPNNNNHDNMNYLQPSTTQDPNLYGTISQQSLGGGGGGTGGGVFPPSSHVDDGLLSNVLNVENNTNNSSITTYSSSATTTTLLASTSPEENLVVDQMNEFQNNMCSPTPTMSDSWRGVQDIDDLSGEHFWKEILDQVASSSLL